MKRQKVARAEPDTSNLNGDLKAVKTVNDANKIFSKTIERETHLFKLGVAFVLKFMGRSEKTTDPERDPHLFVAMEHCHIFRTMDSDGRQHTKSVPTAGHYHNLVLEDQGPSKPPAITAMSGPKHMVAKIVNGQEKFIEEDVNHYDDHIHEEVIYYGSQKIESRTSNQAAQIYIANKTATPTAPGGLKEG